MSAESYDVTEDEFWRDGYDTGHEHGSEGMPNMLDVRGRPMADVIPLSDWLPTPGTTQ